MSRYTGLPDKLRAQVFERDNQRCRWCGVTNRPLDVHHIEYRRGNSYDVLENLVALCRNHHSFVHGTTKTLDGHVIIKSTAQQVLFDVINTPGSTGISVWKRLRKARQLAGLCLDHGSDTCLECNVGVL